MEGGVYDRPRPGGGKTSASFTGELCGARRENRVDPARAPVFGFGHRRPGIQAGPGQSHRRPFGKKTGGPPALPRGTRHPPDRLPTPVAGEPGPPPSIPGAGQDPEEAQARMRRERNSKIMKPISRILKRGKGDLMAESKLQACP